MNWAELCVGAVLAVLLDEVLGWSGALANWLVRANARRAPLDLRDRLEEEWLAALEAMPGRLSRLFFALDCRRASWMIWHERLLPGVSPWVPVRVRLFDFLLSLWILVLVWPVLGMAVIGIKLEHGWRAPVFCRRPRVGRGSRPFFLIRFRTEPVDGQAGQSRVGNFLSRCGIDSLPSLFNILAGDMSVVGPTPESPELVSALSKVIPFYGERHRVRPGLLSWGALCYPFRRLSTLTQDSAHRLSYDLYFVEHMLSLLPRVAILMEAVEIVFRFRPDKRPPWSEAQRRDALRKTSEERGRNSRVDAWIRRTMSTPGAGDHNAH